MNARAVFYLLLTLVATLPTSAFAQRSSSVIDLRPNPTFDPDLSGELRLALGGPVELVEPPSALIEALRWQGEDPMRSDCESQAGAIARALEGEAVPEGSAARFEALVSLAAKRNLFLDIGGSEAALELARYWLPCLDEPLGGPAVAGFLLQEALTHFYREGQADDRYFDNVVAVDPEAYRDASMAPPVRQALKRAAERMVSTEKISLELDIPGVIIDGAPAAEGSVLTPGRHVFQVSSQGNTMRSRWVAVNPSAEPMLISDLTSFALPVRSDIARELARDLVTEGLSASHRAALDATLANTRAQAGPAATLTFVLMDVDKWAVRIYAGDGVVTAVPLKNPQPRAPRQSGGGGHSSVVAGPYFHGFFPTSSGEIAWPGRVGYTLQWHRALGPVVVGVRGFISPHVGTQGVVCEDANVSPQDTSYDVTGYLACLPQRSIFGAGLGVGYDLRPSARWSITPEASLEATWLPQLVFPMPDIGIGGVAYVGAVTWGPMGNVTARRLIPLEAGTLFIGAEVRAGLMTIKVEDVRASVVPAGMSLLVGVEL